ncbi:LysR family transcriptional regulator [Parasphingopyxis algicola]|uniref:LysR family transcriptional regulator n=1 Tax=Parasphingopyxis algicola TaxID=2026624 RepID=UPI0015A19AF9|nr:LysR family transcriptional regulator [Parasphingopyxis algicola]QLC24867.1 LysR family transcriptional regulator [Parasphingopyxis algicola]
MIEDLVDARIIVELHNRLSFSEAASALGIPAATVSRRIMRMEQRAGLKLFDRTTRAVAPTDAGLLAFDHATRMLTEHEGFEVSLASMRENVIGTVRVTTPTIFGQALLGEVVAGFLNEHARCDLKIDLLDRPVNLVEEPYDVAIRIGPIVDDGLIARPVGTVRAGLYRCAKAADIAIDELGHVPMGLLHDAGKTPPLLPLVSQNGEETVICAANARLICMNPWLLLDAASSTNLVVVLPEIIAAPALREGRLQRILPTWFARQVPVHLVFAQDRQMRPAVRAFIEAATQSIPMAIANAEAE